MIDDSVLRDIARNRFELFDRGDLLLPYFPNKNYFIIYYFI